MNFRMFGVTIMSSVAAGMLFGVAPLLAGFSFGHHLRDAGRGSSHHGLRSTLVAVQIAIALVLLTGSGLLMNSFFRLVRLDRNFDPRGLVTFEFRIPLQEYLKGLGSYRGLPVSEVSPPSARMQRVYEKLRTLPGADSAAGISFPPVNGLALPSMTILVEGRPAPRTDAERSALNTAYFLITPNFFATMKTPFVSGRDIDNRDTPSSPRVAIINEAAARRFWPGEDPIGKRLTLDVASGEQPREVVGVVRDVPLRYIVAESEPVIYTSYLQHEDRYRGPFANMFGQMVFMIRTSSDRLSLVTMARKAVAEVEPDRPLSDVKLMEQSLGGPVLERGYYALVIFVFAFTATLLAAVGIYGVMAYTVARRTQEIGIRIALGANGREIFRLVGRRALWLIGSGLAFGLAGSIVLTQLIASQLWGVTPTDPLTFTGVSLLLLLVALLACFIPARRAIRIDPVEALR
jgi:putative ABC transport system permease protein